MTLSTDTSSHHSTPNLNTWYASWFDSPFYHILYKDRNYREAQLFMDNLTQYLNLPAKAKVLDLACGKGRHSIYLNQLGFEVLGVDLSENSINEAKKNENNNLHFKVHDMRENLTEKFDAIFNLFTSFGYFENENDNLKTLLSIKNCLSEYGFAVIDFMNVNHVIANLIPEETKIVDEIEFKIKRYLSEDKFIVKEIAFTTNATDYHFSEKVKAFGLDDFQQMISNSGLYLLDIFGDYKLKKFHKLSSERLIMIFK